MDKWKGKYALITGASRGVGAAVCQALLKQGVNVIGCGRHQKKLEEFQQELTGPGQFIALRCDIAQEMEIMNMMKHIKEKYGTIHILINNAGINTGGSLLHGTTDDWAIIMDINVIGTSVVTKEAINLMRQANVEYGYIINMNSVLGKTVKPVSSMHMFAASKHAMNAITQGLRNELKEEGLPISITQIFTDITTAKRISRIWTTDGDEALEAESSFDMSFTNLPGLSASSSPASPNSAGVTPEDVSDRVISLLSEPIKRQIGDITVEPPTRRLNYLSPSANGRR